MAKRFTEEVGIQQQNLSTGFVGGANTLLNRLQSFKQSTDRLVDVVETQRGQEAAQEAIAQGKPFERKEASLGEQILTGGVSTRAYNKSLETAYLAGLSNDSREALAGIESENPDNITQFNEKAAGYVNGVLKEVDPTVRNQVSQFLDGQMANARIRVHGNTIKKNKAEAAAESAQAVTAFGNDAALLSREGNQEGAAEAILQSHAIIDGMVEAGDLDSNKATNMKREIEREASEQNLRKRFDDLVTTDGLETAFNELDAISNKPAKGWTPDEWDNFVSSEQADLRQKGVRLQQAKAKTDLETARRVSNLKIKANTGQDLQGNSVSPSEIMGETEKMFNEGVVSESERSSILTSMVKKQQEDAEIALKKQKVALRVNGSTKIALTQEEVDLAWDEDIAPSIDQLPPEMQNTAIAQFADSTKAIPTEVKRQVTSDLNSEDVELVANAADLMDRLDDVRGIPDNNFSPTDRAYAEVVVELQKNMEPLEAIKLARQNTNPNDKGRIETRQGIIKGEKFALEYPSIVENAFDPFFSAPTTDQVSAGQLTTEYKSLFEQHFIAGMSEDSAQEKALQIIKRNWGETNVTGKPKAIKYPPEDYYAVNGSVDYIGKDLFTSISDQNIGLPEFKREDIILMSDQTTAREASKGSPTYMVMIDGGEKGLLPIIGFRYVPDMQKQIDKEAKENEKRISEGRKSKVSSQKQVLENLFSQRF